MISIGDLCTKTTCHHSAYRYGSCDLIVLKIKKMIEKYDYLDYGLKVK